MIEISDLFSKTARTVAISIGQATFSVSYDLHKATVGRVQELNNAGENLDPVLRFLADVLRSIDLTKNGVPIQATYSDLRDNLPMFVLMEIVEGIVRDSSGKALRETTSTAG